MAARAVQDTDIKRIVAAVYRQVEKTKERSKKRWTKFIDADAVLDEIFASPHAYVLDDTFLVMCNIGTPWYSPEGVSFLEEKLVLHLGGSAPFSVVPAFLEQLAETEGAQLIAVGTALAISDRSLCRVYSRYGYIPEVVTLTKEIEP